jgi:hypothetical protein
MACDHCKTAERECDCGEGPCPDCYVSIFGEEGPTPEQRAEIEAINKDVDEFLDANPGIELLLNQPGVYVSSHIMESVPGILEVTPMQYSFESPVEHWSSSTPNVQNVQNVQNPQGTPTGESELVMADVYGSDVRLLRNWDKSVKADASPFAGLDLPLHDRLILLIPNLGAYPSSPAFKEAVEREAGPCDIKVIGTVVQITRLTPNPDGTHLEMQIEY